MTVSRFLSARVRIMLKAVLFGISSCVDMSDNVEPCFDLETKNKISTALATEFTMRLITPYIHNLPHRVSKL